MRKWLKAWWEKWHGGCWSDLTLEERRRAHIFCLMVGAGSAIRPEADGKIHIQYVDAAEAKLRTADGLPAAITGNLEEKRFNKRSKSPELPPVKATFAGQPIRSEYVLNRLRNTKWEDRKTILDLIQLERYVLVGPKGWIDAMGSGALKQQYPDAVDAIESECLPPDELAAWRKGRAEIKRHVEEEKAAKEARELREAEEARKEWLALGGKP